MYFTDIASIKRLVRVTNELTDSEIQGFIEFTDQDIIADYGKAVKNMSSTVGDGNSSGRTTYYLNPDLNEAYKVNEVKVNGSCLVPFIASGSSSVLGSGSYTFGAGSYANGVVLNSTDVSTYDGKLLEISYIPQIFHNLATFMTSFDLIQSMHIVAGRDDEFPRTAWIKQRIEQVKSEIQDTYVVDKNYVPKADNVDQTTINVRFA